MTGIREWYPRSWRLGLCYSRNPAETRGRWFALLTQIGGCLRRVFIRHGVTADALHLLPVLSKLGTSERGQRYGRECALLCNDLFDHNEGSLFQPCELNGEIALGESR